MSSYEKAKELTEALVVTGKWPWFHADVIDDQGTICLSRDRKRTWYHQNGLVTVFPVEGLSKGGPVSVDTVPPGIKYLTYKHPWKQYIVVTGHDGMVRYYLLPEPRTYNPTRSPDKLVKLGLTLMPHPDKYYVPVDALPDYEISISRQLKGAAMAKWSDFFAYVKTMWDLLPAVPSNWATIKEEANASTYRPYHDDRESWYPITQYWKTVVGGASAIAEIRVRINRLVMQDDLPYDVKRVPEIQSSHTKHWSAELVKKLGAAGRLDDLPEA